MQYAKSGGNHCLEAIFLDFVLCDGLAQIRTDSSPPKGYTSYDRYLPLTFLASSASCHDRTIFEFPGSQFVHHPPSSPIDLSSHSEYSSM